MAQFVGSVYLDVRIDPTQAASAIKGAMGSAGAAGGAAAGDAISSAMGSKLLQFGTQATRIGRQMSFGLSAPLGALGAAADKAFLAYDTQLTKVAALTGVGAQQTQAWSQQVLDLASKYGIAGEDAAKALYLITSSGISGQAALDTLDTTLKASAVQMGDAATLAGLLTSAMNAYGESNLPAARAADILTGAVQESKVPADQLAGSISNLLPFGKQLGVGFDQIAGSMAALSLQGTNAAMAATQLRGIFNGLLDPSAQAGQALLKIGLSADTVKKTLADQGIVAAIRQIRDGIVSNGGEADSELANIFGNVRALTGVFGLLNDEGGKVDRVMANTANSVGKLDKAFLVTADSAGFKARVATEGLHNSMIDLGSSIAPITTALTSVARAGVDLINSLGPAKYVAVGFGALLVAVGPLTYSFGALASLAGGLATTLGFVSASSQAATLAQLELTASATAAAVAEAELALANGTGTAASLALAEAASAAAAAELAEATAATAATGPIAAFAAAAMAAIVPIAAAVVAVGGAFLLWKIRMDQAQASADALGDVFANKVARGGIKEANDTIGKTQAQIKELSDEVADSHAPWDADYRAELEKGIDVLKAHIVTTQADMDMAAKMSAQTGQNADTLFQWISNERNAGRVYASTEEALKAYTAAVAAHGPVVEEAATSTGKLVDKAKEISDKFFAATAAQKGYDDALVKITDSERAVADAGRALVDAHRDESDAVGKVVEAHQRHADALAKVTDASLKLQEAQATLNELLKGPTRDEQLDVRSAELAVKRAQANARKPGQDPLDRQQGQIDVERAKLALDTARGAHAKNLAKAQGDVADAEKGVTDAQRDALSAAKGITDAQRGVEDAHRGVEDAERGVTKAQQDLAQAQIDAVGAASTLAQKQGDLANALAAGGGAAEHLVGYLTELKQLYPDAAGGLDVYLERAKALEAFFNPPVPPPPPPSPEDAAADQGRAAGASAYRAAGGPLSAGQLSTVNELGLPELWTQGGKQYLLPLSAGQVTPIHPADLPVHGGDGFSVGDINVYEMSGKPRQTAYEVRRELHKTSYLSGRRR